MADATARGYPYPEGMDVWRASAEDDGGAPWRDLAEAVDADVAAVEAAASGATSGVASDLADHEAATTSVHGIADTSVLVTTARQITAGTGLTGGGTLASDRTISIAAGGVGTTELANDAVTTGKIAAGAVGTTDLADSAVTDTKLAGSINPSKVTGTAVVQARTITAGTGLTGGGDLSADRTISIAAGGVGTTQLADDAVTSAKIAAGAVGTTDIADSAVTSAKLADGAIVDADVNASAAIAPSKISGTAVVQARTITGVNSLTGGGDLSANRTLDVADGGIGTAELADSAVTTGKIADGAVTLAKLSGTSGLVAAGTLGNLLSEGMATSEDGVTVWRGTSGSPVITNDNTYARTGTRSQKIVTTQNSAIASPTLGTGLSQRYAVTPGRRYTFAAWVRTDTADENWYARIYWYTSDNVASATATHDSAQVTVAVGDWTLLTVSAMAPSDAAVCSPAISRATGTIGAAVWADDASFHAGVGGYPSPPGQVITGTQPSRSVIVTKDGVSNNLSPSQPVVVNYGGNVTWVLPNAVDNYGVVFTLINRGTGTVTISRPATEPRTINGLAFSPTIPAHGQIQVVSTGDTWRVLSGEYTSNAVGKATYMWDHTANSTTASAWWRLVRYHSGWRDITASLINGWTATQVAVMRDANTITFQLSGLSGAAATASDIITDLSTGWVRPFGATTRAVGAASTTTATVFTLSATGGLSTPARDSAIVSQVSFAVTSTLPTSLPGTEITAPV